MSREIAISVSGYFGMGWSVEGQQHIFGLEKLFWLVI